jgi:tight adherence protein B
MIVAVVSAAVAAWLWLRPPPRCRWPTPRRGPLSWGPVAVVAVVVALGSLPTRLVVLGVIVVGAVAALARLRQRQSRRRAAEQTSSRVREACEQLGAELGSGQPPGVALRRVSADWALLAPAAEAFDLGADVPSALRAAAAQPGASDLRLLAAGWQVTHRTGAGLAAAVDRIAASLREEHATRRLVAGELSSARATARLVAGLPVLALAMGSGAGGAPWHFLLATPIGLACLASGLGLALAGLWWIEALTGETGEPR